MLRLWRKPNGLFTGKSGQVFPGPGIVSQCCFLLSDICFVFYGLTKLT